MRVTIEAAPLLYRSAGVKNYLYYWIRCIRQQPRSFDVQLFPFLNEPSALDHERPCTNRAGAFARLGLMYLLNRIPADLARLVTAKSDLFHSSKLIYPPRNSRMTATLHDFTWRLMPELHSPANVLAEERFADRVLKRADALIAVSEATRSDAVRVLNLDPEKITVIHHGVADEFFHVTQADADVVRARYKLIKPYALFVGTIEPRKNIRLLLDAYQSLPASIRDEIDLVLAGPRGWLQEDVLKRLQTPPAGVRYLGYVPEPDLPGLFAGALTFVYPSVYEGFGFPVAQAMAAGAPVITSSVSALPEVAGGAAVLVDPRSESELRKALADVLTSESLRTEMSQAGRRNACRFSWTECARRSVLFFESALGR